MEVFKGRGEYCIMDVDGSLPLRETLDRVLKEKWGMDYSEYWAHKDDRAIYFHGQGEALARKAHIFYSGIFFYTGGTLLLSVIKSPWRINGLRYDCRLFGVALWRWGINCHIGGISLSLEKGRQSLLIGRRVIVRDKDGLYCLVHPKENRKEV